eukprot:CAMPEP_0176497252 /NCGR_PEP_ID=MMETSP0200_2-20121128/11622_1 /TAXON_ID=947934 /ORGANISM="Chaetoceros sp., Strain GSL56" /LENGTH=176 /DNA_ID=CAMNT_0017895247 /DNA_START=77 /DNA_END=607 /DNA_ORIENTATION=-
MALARGIRGFSSFPYEIVKTHARSSRANCPTMTSSTYSRKLGTARFMSSFKENSVAIKQIDKKALHEIIEDIESTSREESGYVVIDVRNEDEIAYTGKLSECVEILPLPLIAQMGAFSMTEEDFEDSFGFAKPKQDETIIFTCKAGIRSMHAAQYAAMNGYSNLINYTGGAMDWFR